VPTYHGSCHCGAVRLEVALAAPICRLLECNCSVCTKKGIVHHPAADDELRVVEGQENLVLYQFHTAQARHWFCGKCGIHTHGRPRNNTGRFTVNARCLDEFDTIRAGAELVQFDGKNHPKDTHRD